MDAERAMLRFVSTSHGTTVAGHICSECVYNKGKYASFGEHPEICIFDKTDACSAKTPYFFFRIRNERSVALFSKGRIPFDCSKTDTELLKILKKELVLALKLLQSFENSVLCAKYGTTDEAKNYFDVENVLFYNVGTSIFNSLTQQGVKFSHISSFEIAKLQKQWNIPEEYSHYYEYTLHSKPLLPPQMKNPLAEWDNIRFCKCVGLTPLMVWKTIKDEAVNIQIYDKINCDYGDNFSLFLEIEKPKQVKFSIMTAMKPLLDGLICAFHNSDFEESEVDYFSQKLKCNRDKIKSKELNILGERKSKYIQIYRNNVKWNPADDMCQHVTISIKEGNLWKLSGKIYSYD
ncbi:MAG: hypothetical protein IJZ57_08110 [Clostridia bacterium]|nr:hypothetical protein [Clostridia bacterium]